MSIRKHIFYKFRKHKVFLTVIILTLILIYKIFPFITPYMTKTLFSNYSPDAMSSASIQIGKGIGNSSLIESAYYSKLADKKVHCNLCPKFCVIKEGDKGFCNVRINKNGTLYTQVYGQLATHIGPISEKTPFLWQAINKRWLKIGGVGCNLKCDFCFAGDFVFLNTEDVKIKTFSPRALVDLALEEKCSSICYTTNDPIVNYEFVLELGKIIKSTNLKYCLSSSAYINLKPLEELSNYIDGVAIGLKSFSEKVYQKHCQGNLKPILKSLLLLKQKNVPIIIFYLVIPTISDSQQQIKLMCQWVKQNLGEYTPLYFMRYEPSYRLKNLPPTPVTTLREAKKIAEEVGLKFANYYLFYLSNSAPSLAIDETVYCPFCGKVLLKKEKNNFINNVKGKHCKWCGKEIPGAIQLLG